MHQKLQGPKYLTNPELHKLLDTIPRSNIHVARACLELLQADSPVARLEARLESAPYDMEMSNEEIQAAIASRREAHEDDEWSSLDELQPGA